MRIELRIVGVEIRCRFECSIRERELGADDRLDPCRARGFVEARRAVDTVAVDQRNRLVAEIGGSLDDRFRQRSALEKLEGGSSLELEIHGGDERLRARWRPVGPDVRRAIMIRKAERRSALLR